jgi:hypothetical protein
LLAVETNGQGARLLEINDRYAGDRFRREAGKIITKTSRPDTELPRAMIQMPDRIRVARPWTTWTTSATLKFPACSIMSRPARVSGVAVLLELKVRCRAEMLPAKETSLRPVRRSDGGGPQRSGLGHASSRRRGVTRGNVRSNMSVNLARDIAVAGLPDRNAFWKLALPL